MENRRIYTEATPLLKELHKNYKGNKTGIGNVDTATYFDNTDSDYNTGCFTCNVGSTLVYKAEVSFDKVSEQGFIDHMQFSEELLTKCKNNLLGVNPSTLKVEETLEDIVNKPKHYTDGKIEVIDFIEDKGFGFHLANAVKYLSRAGKKDPSKTKEDLKKAVWYINRYIETQIKD